MTKSKTKTKTKTRKQKGGLRLETYFPREDRTDEEYADYLEGRRLPRYQWTFPPIRNNEAPPQYISRVRRNFTRLRESPIDQDYPYSPTPPSPSTPTPNTPVRRRRNRTRSAPSNRKKSKKSMKLALKGKYRRRRASAPSNRKKMSSAKARNWLLHERLKKSRKSKK